MMNDERGSGLLQWYYDYRSRFMHTLPTCEERKFLNVQTYCIKKNRPVWNTGSVMKNGASGHSQIETIMFITLARSRHLPSIFCFYIYIAIHKVFLTKNGQVFCCRVKLTRRGFKVRKLLHHDIDFLAQYSSYHTTKTVYEKLLVWCARRLFVRSRYFFPFYFRYFDSYDSY